MKELMGLYINKESEDARKEVNRAGKQGLMASVFAGIREFFSTPVTPNKLVISTRCSEKHNVDKNQKLQLHNSQTQPPP